MYLHLSHFLELGPAVGDVFASALTSPHAVRDLLPNLDTESPVLRRLQHVSQAGPTVLDLWGADMHLSTEDIGKTVRAIRTHWHRHGFCLTRCHDSRRWTHASYEFSQPLLCWRGLSMLHGWDQIGGHLRATELDVFRHLIEYGSTTAEQVACDGRIFSQRPNFADWRVQHEIALGRYRPGPSAFNRSEAQRILHQMLERRLIIERLGLYQIVRPTRDEMA